jgi:dimethylaniline monooxygenase (N-oxide forming)
MCTNLSKETCAFSDWEWSATVSEFPNQALVGEYLRGYSDHFGVASRIKFNSRVDSVVHDGSSWQVTYSTNGEKVLQLFDYLIIASGFFSIPKMPDSPSFEIFEGQVRHAADYWSRDEFVDKRVVIIGGAFSAFEIAAEIAEVAKHVTHVFRRVPWILPRYLVDGRPLDAQLNIRSSGPKLSNPERNSYLSKIALNPSDNFDTLWGDPNSSNLPYVVISDNYLTQVRLGKISPQIAELESATGSVIRLNNRKEVTTDFALFATGYEVSLPFFSPELRQQINFDPTDQFQPPPI